MMTPSTGRHGSGSRKHAASGTGTRRPNTESRTTGGGRLSGLLASAQGLLPRGPHARLVLLAVGAAILAVAVILTTVLQLPNRSVRVPDLVGMPREQASVRLTSLGLAIQVRDTKFSPTVAEGSIASQEPSSGLLVAPGTVIVVDLSAGSESFALPDVIGQDLDAARALLRSRGLTVTFTTAVSDAGSGTVIASAPAAGEPVKTGDGVRLTIATTVGAVAVADLTGVTIMLDPEPPGPKDVLDVNMDVATRVSALLSAAGATVMITRDSGVTSSTPAERLAVVRETSATALVGFTIAASSLEGMLVLTMPSEGVSAEARALSAPLADATLASLAVDFSTISTLTASGDTVLAGAGLPAVRIRLGSFASAADVKSFARQSWLSLVSGDVYRALANLYGRR